MVRSRGKPTCSGSWGVTDYGRRASFSVLIIKSSSLTHFRRPYHYCKTSTNEPTHEIMALFVLRKLILQTCMRSHPVGFNCLIFGRTLRLLSYFLCTNSESEPSPVAYVKSTIVSWAGSNVPKQSGKSTTWFLWKDSNMLSLPMQMNNWNTGDLLAGFSACACSISGEY